MIKYKKRFAKAFIQWCCITALIPLGIYAHVGFMYLFTAFSWIAGGVCGLMVIVGILMTFTGVETKLIHTSICDGIRKTGGIDKIYAEQEQKYMDYIFLYGITIYLIFTGHIMLTILWCIYILGQMLTMQALDSFDDQVIDAI